MMLTKQHEAFCREYVLDWNATRAYRAVYKDGKSVNASVHSNILMKMPKIQARIKEIVEDDEKYCNVSRRLVIAEHMKIVRCSISDFHDTWIERKAFEDLSEEQKSCISEIVVEKRPHYDGDGKISYSEYVKIKLYDRQKSLDAVSKLFGYNAPKELKVSDEFVKTYVIRPASQRADSKR